MKSYDFLEPAQLELEEEVRYFNDREEGLGYEFAKEVANTISRILRYPEAWTKLSKRTRRQISRQKKKSKSNIMGYGLAFYSPAVVE